MKPYQWILLAIIAVFITGVMSFVIGLGQSVEDVGDTMRAAQGISLDAEETASLTMLKTAIPVVIIVMLIAMMMASFEERERSRLPGV